MQCPVPNAFAVSLNPLSNPWFVLRIEAGGEDGSPEPDILIQNDVPVSCRSFSGT
jgi:hypothetical protein